MAGLALKESILSSSHPSLSPPVKYTYGTAGFRTIASTLDPVLFRVGLLAALRSMKLQGKWVGVMVTASHNPEEDNGVKLVDPTGEMLVSSWEAHATVLANCLTPSSLLSDVQELIEAESIDTLVRPQVVYGHDTRPSCPSLIRALEDGLAAFPVLKKFAAGLVTTPQLHYLVRCLNTTDTKEAYGEPSVEGYYVKLASAFEQVIELLPSTDSSASVIPAAKGALTIDCANGVGAPGLQGFLQHLGPKGRAYFTPATAFCEVGKPGALNFKCGADWVKTTQSPPAGLVPVPSVNGERYASFDGDADRVVYYYATLSDRTFKLLDGDKLATLLASFLRSLVQRAGLGTQAAVGIVQTAYANGASTAYVSGKLGVPVTCVPTGVKHLHHAAQEYGVGVYFEANGHGTVLFSEGTKAALARASEGLGEEEKNARKLLKAIIDLTNETVGDALSDLLLVESVLLHESLSPAGWDSAYTDLSNRLLKVSVPDRSAFSTTDSERRCLTPAGLQDAIDALVKKYEQGRAFVRPSGTEDCVRVYAEARTKEGTEELARGVEGLVRRFARASEGSAAGWQAYQE